MNQETSEKTTVMTQDDLGLETGGEDQLHRGARDRAPGLQDHRASFLNQSTSSAEPVVEPMLRAPTRAPAWPCRCRARCGTARPAAGGANSSVRLLPHDLAHRLGELEHVALHRGGDVERGRVELVPCGIVAVLASTLARATSLTNT